MNTACALYTIAPQTVELRSVALPIIAADECAAVQVKTLWSGISRGTERLVFRGQVPASQYKAMRAPFQDGAFPFPVKYGYAAVGIVEIGPPALKAKAVFCLHPHQDRFVVPAEAVIPLPDAIPPRRAILAANMETALNVMWDSAAMPGDRIAIVGAGALGLLILSLATAIPGTDVVVADVNHGRASVVEAFGARFCQPDALTGLNADVVIHTSATGSGLAACLGAAGFEARIVEASWYGSASVIVPLGEAFHSKRLKLISSQVGSVCETHRARWPHSRRLAKAISLLQDPCLDLIITDEVPFAELDVAMPAVFDASPSSIVTAIRYD